MIGEFTLVLVPFSCIVPGSTSGEALLVLVFDRADDVRLLTLNICCDTGTSLLSLTVENIEDVRLLTLNLLERQ